MKIGKFALEQTLNKMGEYAAEKLNEYKTAYSSPDENCDTVIDSENIQCYNCGMVMKAGSKFCSRCGSTVDNYNETEYNRNDTEAKTDHTSSVQYCKFCGTMLDADSKFCKSCGKVIESQNHYTHKDEYTNDNHDSNERKTSYEGVLHKCPNCGEVLESFQTNCPSCGYEIRDGKASTVVQEFALKLERIESRRMPIPQSQTTLMGRILDKALEEDEEEKRRDFEKQKEREKRNLIVNFSVPNTKETIIEFVLLSLSNIDVRKLWYDDVTKAWATKLEQIYKKAQLSMPEADFMQIHMLCHEKLEEIEKKNKPLSWLYKKISKK